ncbi:MAG: penicillin-binding protein 1C [Chitinophagaceae bacterium]|jgi:penicillin-binding protein 1C|nr:penicillin-binding protein 1C [Chitinophagaceae bacterium]
MLKTVGLQHIFYTLKYLQKIAQYFYHLSTKSKIKWAIGICLFIWFWFSLPNVLFNTPTSFVITDKNNQLLNASIAADGQWRFPFNKNVPSKFEACITTFEDKRFFYHLGIDPIAIARAIKQNLGNKKTVSGGSTLTMQVIRLHKQNNQRNFWNKLSESILAIRLECSYRKKTILALYASNAPFGSNVVGLDAAAWRYFGRSAEQLTWGEMAALAVLPNAPSLVHPGKNTPILLRKRNALLDKLLANKTIDAVTCELAKLEALPGEPKALPQLAPHLLDRFKKEYSNLQAANNLTSTALQTTVDATLQLQINRIIEQHHQQLKGNQIKNAAALVVEINTGNVLAYVGNVYNTKDVSLESHVDVLNAARSPGSTLKPILYAALLSEGSMLPKQLIPDIPTQMGGYTPQNFDLGFDGAVPANRALSRSLNIPAVKMLQQYKYQRLYNLLKQVGLTTLNKSADYYGMSLILGGCEVKPYELAGVYTNLVRMYLNDDENTALKNSGAMLNYIKQKDDASVQSTTKSNSTSHPNSSFNNVALYHTFNAMNEVMRPGEEGLWNLFSSAQRIAWKTGTSFGFRDGWAVGFTTKHCVLVWVGNTTGEGRPNLTGIQTAAPILFDIFRLLPSSNWFEAPKQNFNYIKVCTKSGFKTSLDCATSENVMVYNKNNIAAVCPYCKKVNVDATKTYRVNETCEQPSNMLQESYFILPPTIEYYYKQKHPDYVLMPVYKPGCTTDGAKLLEIIYPVDEAKIFIPKEISGQKGNTIFTATHKNSAAKLFWHIDNAYVGTTEKFHQLSINPIVGKHQLTIVDGEGNSVSKNFEIVEK